MRLICAVALLVLAFASFGQAAENEVRGWSFFGSFSGSSNSDGTVAKATPALGYRFNDHFSTYAGVPFYFVNLSRDLTTAPDAFMTGVGNAFLGFRAGVHNDLLTYTSNLELTAPTGDRTRGFSTGRVTADWTNQVSRKFSSLTPFGSAGIANTVSDTAFFVRPFTSLGLVGHFEGGATYELNRAVDISASAYAVRGSGSQRIISKVMPPQAMSSGRGNGSANRIFESQQETVAQAETVDDHGASAWFSFTPNPAMDFHVGYSRSTSYQFNTLFYGIGFHVGH